METISGELDDTDSIHLKSRTDLSPLDLVCDKYHHQGPAWLYHEAGAL